jgi:hypothetical protein
MARQPDFFKRRDPERRHTPSVQASNLEAAMRDSRELARQAPSMPKPREMIEQVRVVGKDKLTAADHALYEGLIAWAQDHDPNAESHDIPLEAITGYAGIDSTDALVAAMHRLGTTHVKYDIRSEDWRRRGTLPLVVAEVAEHLKRGDGHVRFSIPEPVRRLMVAPKSYAMLEMSALPRFRSRYSSRLYQRLALRAGYSDKALGEWEIEPEALARSLGFTWTRYADFRRNVLEPALEDLKREVRRFGVTCMPVYARGRVRGRPAVERLRFELMPVISHQPLAALAKTPMSPDEVAYIERYDGRIAANLIPRAETISRLITYRRKAHPAGRDINAAALSEFWRAAVDEALAGEARPDFRAPLLGNDLWGEDLLKAVDLVGLDDTVRVWVDCCEWTGRYMPRLDPAPVPMDDIVSEGVDGEAPVRPDGVYQDGVLVERYPTDRAERKTYFIKKNARGELETLGQLPTKSSMFGHYMSALCDPGAFPLANDQDDQPIVPVLAPALRIVGRMTDRERQRRTAINLLSAVAEYDLDKVASISRAVLASAKSRPTLEVP